MLTPGESIDDFKEVTANEKAAIEASDAKWERPSYELIAEYDLAMFKYEGSSSHENRLAFGHYYADSGYFMYGDVPLTMREARLMLAYRKSPLYNGQQAYAGMWHPTAIAPIIQKGLSPMSFAECFSMCRALKVVALQGYYSGMCNVSNANRMFASCSQLTTVLGELYMSSCGDVDNMFIYCSKLREVRLNSLKVSISLEHSPNISMASLTYMVEHAANTKAITITLHPTAYARVTDELFALAAEKNITIAST